MFFIIIIFVCIGIYICLYIYSSKYGNLFRHLTDLYTFAHFSSITEKNKWVFPAYARTSPIYLEVKEGEAIYIPRKWWHWITSDKDTVAVSFWNKANDRSKRHMPSVFKMKYSDTLLPELQSQVNQSSNGISLWNSKSDKIEPLTTDSIGCIITLPGYANRTNAKMNPTLLEKVKKYITYPNWDPVHIDANLWICKTEHDTGLHYDDYDGILQVLKGKKYIRLFSPEQSKYLSPHSVVPGWAQGRADRMHYNKYTYIGPHNGWPSARLLYETVKERENTGVLQEINKAVKESTQPLVWGCKWHNGVMRWELYQYFYHIYYHELLYPSSHYSIANGLGPCVIESFDLFDVSHDIKGNTIHCYHSEQGNHIELPFYGKGTQIKHGTTTHEFESQFIYDTVDGCRNNFIKYITHIGFSESVADQCQSLLYAYECKEMCLWYKESSSIFIQYFDISFEAFCTFLRTHSYPPLLIQHVESNKNKYKNLIHEITVVYDINTLQPIRSAFYGAMCP
jgi:hypothetical protein